MHNLMKAVIMLWCLYWPSAGYAGEAPETPAQAEHGAEAASAQGKRQEKEGGHTLFWLVFLFSILFVVSSAAGLNALGGKPPPRGKGNHPSPRTKRPDDSHRFRL